MMQIEQFTVQNVKCGGCASNIQEGLSELTGISSVKVEIETGQVEVQGDNLDRQTLTDKLASLGYPEV